jgi:hypothetical protein
MEKATMFNSWRHLFETCCTLFLILVVASTAWAQSSGGSFQMTSSVVAGGGGSNSSSGSFKMDGTPGQNGAGTLTNNGTFTQLGGFWPTTIGLTPTAAGVSVGGQVTTPSGGPLGGVVLMVTGSKTARTISDANGAYAFVGLDAGGFYTVTPSLVNYAFAPAERSFSAEADKTDAVFTANQTATTGNPLDTNLFFVRQHYLDFLNREPDAPGLEYWTWRLDQCGNHSYCLVQARIGVSAAFFVEAEFQKTGSFIYGLYKASLGARPAFSQFTLDRGRLIGGPNLDVAKTSFANDFVQRSAFLQRYPSSMGGAEFIDALLITIRTGSGVDLSDQRPALLDDYAANGSRSRVLRTVVESSAFSTAEYNRAFVLAQYFGYLQRDPDEPGYEFWVNVLNNREPGNFRGMVCSFITSQEYQNRFSSIHPHSNSECGK